MSQSIWSDIVMGVELQSGIAKIRLGTMTARPPETEPVNGDAGNGKAAISESMAARDEGQVLTLAQSNTLILPLAGFASLVRTIDQMREVEKLKPFFDNLDKKPKANEQSATIEAQPNQ